MRFHEFRVQKDPACPVCGEQPTLTELIDYEGFCGVPRRGRRRSREIAARRARGGARARRGAAAARRARARRVRSARASRARGWCRSASSRRALAELAGVARAAAWSCTATTAGAARRRARLLAAAGFTRRGEPRGRHRRVVAHRRPRRAALLGEARWREAKIPDPLERRHLVERDADAGARRSRSRRPTSPRTARSRRVDFLRKAGAHGSARGALREAVARGRSLPAARDRAALGESPTRRAGASSRDAAAAAGKDRYAAEARSGRRSPGG